MADQSKSTTRRAFWMAHTPSGAEWMILLVRVMIDMERRRVICTFHEAETHPLEMSVVELGVDLALAIASVPIMTIHSGTHSKPIVELRAAKHLRQSLSACRIENGCAGAGARDAHACCFRSRNTTYIIAVISASLKASCWERGGIPRSLRIAANERSITVFGGASPYLRS